MQILHKFRNVAGAEKKYERCAGFGKITCLFFFRHWGTSCCSGQDNALAYLRSGQFNAKFGGGGKNAAYARNDFNCYAVLLQQPDLFVNRPEKRGVAGMQADNIFSLLCIGAHYFNLFFQVHGRTVFYYAVFSAIGQNFGIDKRTRI